MLLTACRGQGHDSFTPPVFPETKQVTVTPLLNDFLFDLPNQIEDMGDYLVIMGYRENRFLHIFKKISGAYVKSFATLGRGPGEMVGGPSIRMSEDKSKLFAYQRSSNVYWTYNVENIVNDNQVQPVKAEKVTIFLDEGERHPGTITDYLAWKDKRLFMRNRLHRFEVQDTLGNTLYLYDKYPEVPFEQASDSSHFHNSYLHAVLALKPDMSRFVVASYIGCIMEIFTVDSSGKIEKEIEKRFHPPFFTAIPPSFTNFFVSGKTIKGIQDLSVTDEFIYAKYDGSIYYKDQPERSRRNVIAVFDWSGKPIRRYILDWKKFYNFFVDDQQNRCYLIGEDADDEILLGYFDL